MITKVLERKINLLTEENASEEKKMLELEYHLLESDEREIEELAGKKVYGIEIIKKAGNNELESQSVRNLLCSMEGTKAIISKLADNSVTPVSLHYVLEDLISI